MIRMSFRRCYPVDCERISPEFSFFFVLFDVSEGNDEWMGTGGGTRERGTVNRQRNFLSEFEKKR